MGWNQTIGIWLVNENNDTPMDIDFSNDSPLCCALTNSGQTRPWTDDCQNYGAKYVEGDIVEMILDFEGKELRFKVNDVDYGKSHDIKEGSKYRAAVSFYYNGDAMKLL